jgi:hypothetical protein
MLLAGVAFSQQFWRFRSRCESKNDAGGTAPIASGESSVSVKTRTTQCRNGFMKKAAAEMLRPFEGSVVWVVS